MTRETKIGLLVGLAFIIVIGILLSDHINNSTDPAPAAMGQTYNSVRQSVDSPDARNAGVTTVVTPPHPVVPQTQVPTIRDPQPTNSGASVVVIGPGADPSSLPRPNRSTVEAQPNGAGVQIVPPGNTEVASNDNGNTAVPATPDSGAVSNPLTAVARANGEELTSVNGGPVHLNPNANTANPASAPTHTPVALPPGVRQVKAEEGDTVTKLAVKYMGGNTKANREAIIRANPNVGPDGRKVFAGQTYLIPAATAAVASPAAPTPAPVVISSDQMQPVPAPAPKPSPKAAPAPEPLPSGVTLYTVKDDESLWKIASQQLGSGARYAEIRDLNADVLKGSDTVRAGMRLKLPPKAVAASN